MSNHETINDILRELDNCIIKRDKGYAYIDNQYVNSDGHILSVDYDEYKERKDHVTEKFTETAKGLLCDIDSLCKKVRNRQPVLTDLTKEHLNLRNFIPKVISLGKIHVQYENLDIYVPKMVDFPFEKSMYICDEDQIELIHKLFLRLMYALPLGKTEFFVFDPNGLGKNVRVFNSLFSEEKIFPAKGVISSASELKKELKKAIEYAENLIQNVFVNGCKNWTEYNHMMYLQGKTNSVLPYKVFTFIDVPDDMDAECFNMFRKLTLHGKDCGFLVLFSFNEIVLEAEDSKLNTISLELKKCINYSQQLHEIENISGNFLTANKLKLSYVGEKMPDYDTIQNLISIYKDALEENANKSQSFTDVVNKAYLYSENSTYGLSIPIGYDAKTGGMLELKIGDETPHYLIGGTTGSGKSNLLHNVIMSAANKYSPNELQIYLLDFKEGVEFTIYANPLLPHAKLVAVEADTEYGITVLDHLVKEKERRYKLLKESNCKDLKTYRENNNGQIMPRIVVVIDEFQVLFSNENKQNTTETLEMLAKQGRACGIHLILSTQSLKGIEFGSLASQFGGRIALKCSAEDSKQLLGGITSNNEAASEIAIPYAILNTTQGNVSGNIKFSVPYAEPTLIREAVNGMYSFISNGGRISKERIFSGQKLPKITSDIDFSNYDTITFNLGVVMNFDAPACKIKLEAKESNNLLVCGSDEIIKSGLYASMFKSIDGNNGIDKIFYIGNSRIFNSTKNIVFFDNLGQFVEYIKENDYSNSVVFMDGCNLEKEVKYPATAYAAISDEAKILIEYFDNAYKHNSYCVAFYDRWNGVKNSKLPIEKFEHRIGFLLNADEKNSLLGNMSSFGSNPMKTNRAIYIRNGVISDWFMPYVE